MYQIGYNPNFMEPYAWIRAHIEENNDQYSGYYCRGVIVGEGDEAKNLITIIEAIPTSVDLKTEDKTYHYDGVTLFKEVLGYGQLEEWLKRLESGVIPWGDLEFVPEKNQQWKKSKLPLKNDYMNNPGVMLSTTFPDRTHMPGDMLVKPGLPYYPNTAEAVINWLELPHYHGSSDGRNGELIFLFPEVRAFFSSIDVNENDITVHVNGACANKTDLEVTGAWWLKKEIHHINAPVINGEAVLTVPKCATRLEYVLIDDAGTIYDYHSENETWHTGLGRVVQDEQTNRSLESLVEALRQGEGKYIEYKEYVDPLNKKNGFKLKDEKIYEVMKTVCAFANTNGGTIYIGVKDDCQVEDISQNVSKWLGAKADIAAINQYMTAIKTGIRDYIIGAEDLEMDFVEVDGKIVVLIDVNVDNEKTTYIKDEHVMYYRRGANNTKLRPDEWREAICKSITNEYSSLYGY